MFDLICDTLRQTASLGILPSHLATQPLTPDMRLIDLGIDSLGTMTLLSELGGRLSSPMLDVDIGAQTTLAEIAGRLRDLVPVVLPQAA